MSALMVYQGRKLGQTCPRAILHISPTIAHRPIGSPTVLRFVGHYNGIRYSSHIASLKTMTPQEAQTRLAVQRTKRPVSPHLTIYKWRYTSLASILNRITGGILTGGLYGFAIVYLLSPVLGLHLDSTTIAEAFGSLPPGTKVAVKFGAVLPFAYHCFNGTKHLIWDRGYLLRNKQAQYAAWAVAVATLSTSLELALWKFE
ncbi:hypothetical protein DTO166G4_1704 [Paecilomyces variotii]|nr:hypothetical protein DTO166G4_1704 [Paecilomyces variotii]KAJ9238028.1 hypothetical protein DTO166G5_3265 [Paecilomyces variotii]